jgi:hypothetical protein
LRAQVAAYGACVKGALPAVERGACEKEFAALRTCFFDAVRAPRALTRRLLLLRAWLGYVPMRVCSVR